MYKLLLVEDEAGLREYLQRYIDRTPECGFYVYKEFGNGVEVCEYLRAGGEGDLILTDIRMPEMTGIELAKAISEEFFDMNVVIMSGYSEFEDAKLAIKYNVREYLVKPFELSELKNTLIKIKEELDSVERNEIFTSESKHEQLIEAREEFFVDLLFNGIRGKEEIQRRVDKLNFHFDVNKYHYDIIKLSIPEYHDFLENEWHYSKESLSTALYNLLSTILEDKYVYSIIIMNDDFYYAVFHVEDEPIDYDDVADKINRIFRLSVSIKKPGRTFLNIYDILRPEETIVDISEKATMFMTYVKAYELEEAENLLGNIFSNNYSEKLFESVIESLSKVAQEKYAPKLSHINYSSDSTIAIKSILSVFTDSKTDCAQAIEFAKKYIEENYSRNISREDVSKQVFFNPVYFTRIFKQYTGMNFNDYLTKVRIEKSIELLKDKSIKVYEVAKCVGYENSKYFFHVFKLYTGYTPREYRVTVLKNAKKGTEF